MTAEAQPVPVAEPAASNVFDVLQERGFIQDVSDPEELRRRLAAERVTFYYGCDPTAPSLHIGNLIGLMATAWLERAGHRPIALAGGSTGRIGDPSGRDSERELLDEATLERNLAAIRATFRRFVDLADDPEHAAPDEGLVVDNFDWTRDVRLLDFLRDIGKHVSINVMLARESVRQRLDREQGLSFTEFSYQLLQAYDFQHLFATYGCRLQIGGSDQWGNILAGVDLTRRLHGAQVHGLVWPLVTRSDGVKFSKSSGGAIWLSPELTSPYVYYQWFLNVPDADAERFLKLYTFLPLREIVAVMAEHLEEPGARVAQRRLAREATLIAHGEEGLRQAGATTDLLFGDRPFDRLDDGTLAVAFESAPTTELEAARLDGDGVGLLELLVAVGAARSNSEARRLVEGGGVRLNNSTVTDPARRVRRDDLASETTAILRAGKRRTYLARFV